MSIFLVKAGENVLIKIILVHISEDKTTYSGALLPLIQTLFMTFKALLIC